MLSLNNLQKYLCNTAFERRDGLTEPSCHVEFAFRRSFGYRAVKTGVVWTQLSRGKNRGGTDQVVVECFLTWIFFAFHSPLSTSRLARQSSTRLRERLSRICNRFKFWAKRRIKRFYNNAFFSLCRKSAQIFTSEKRFRQQMLHWLW